MIRYSLVCERKHDFEIWFRNSADYDKQAKRGLVTCPACGSSKVEKALMTPRLGAGTRKRRRVRPDAAPAQGPAELASQPEAPAADKAPVAMVASPQERE